MNGFKHRLGLYGYALTRRFGNRSELRKSAMFHRLARFLKVIRNARSLSRDPNTKNSASRRPSDIAAEVLGRKIDH